MPPRGGRRATSEPPGITTGGQIGPHLVVCGQSRRPECPPTDRRAAVDHTRRGPRPEPRASSGRSFVEPGSSREPQDSTRRRLRIGRRAVRRTTLSEMAMVKATYLSHLVPGRELQPRPTTACADTRWPAPLQIGSGRRDKLAGTRHRVPSAPQARRYRTQVSALGAPQLPRPLSREK